MDPEQPTACKLDYQRPLPKQREFLTWRPISHPGVATVLVLPGLFCWIVLLSIFLPRSLGPGFLAFAEMLGPVFMLGNWGVAVIAAIASIYLYLFRNVRRPWYVVINLVVNISGLLFTAILLSFAVANLLTRLLQ